METKPKILIVDDDPEIIRFLTELLESKELEPLAAFNGEEALVKISTFKPSVVLLDIGMPGEDGFKILQNLRSNSNYDAIAIVMLTGKTNESDIVKALELGADDYVGKPFNIKDIIQKINQLLGKSKSGTLPSTAYFKRRTAS